MARAGGGAAEAATTSPAQARVIRDDKPDQTAVLLSWKEAASELEHEALHAVLKNRTDQMIDVELGLFALGPAQREDGQRLSRVKLKAHQERTVEVALDRIAVQAVDAPTQLMLSAQYDVDGAHGSAVAAPLSVTFRGDYRALHVNRNGMRVADLSKSASRETNLDRLADALPNAVEGRYRENGAWHELSEPNADGVVFGARAVLGGNDALIEQLRAMPRAEDAAGAPIKPPQAQGSRPLVTEGTKSLKICHKWNAFFIDRRRGEDYLTGPADFWSATTNDSPNAGYMLFDASNNNAVVTMGYMDLSGCTPSTTLTVGHNYTMVMLTSLITPNFEGANVKIVDHPGWDLNWYGAAFTVSSSSTSPVNLSSVIDPDTNSAAVAERFYQMSPDSPPAGGYFIYAQEPCLSDPTDAGACTSGLQIYLSTNADGSSITTSKFVIAHEIGHAVQSHLHGFWNDASYDLTGEPQLCRCDQVTDTRARAHCLNSAEFNSSAQIEGFAQFWATKTMNSVTQSDCMFVYYKDMFIPALGGAVKAPPVDVSCTGPAKWYSAFCSKRAGNGTEYDWFLFYWNLNSASTRLTLQDISDVYWTACGGHQCGPSNPAPSWALLQLAALAKFGSSSAKYTHFANSISAYGVNF